MEGVEGYTGGFDGTDREIAELKRKVGDMMGVMGGMMGVMGGMSHVVGARCTSCPRAPTLLPRPPAMHLNCESVHLATVPLLAPTLRNPQHPVQTLQNLQLPPQGTRRSCNTHENGLQYPREWPAIPTRMAPLSCALVG